MPRWFIPFLGLAVVFIVGFLVARVLWRRKSVTQPACGNCGYFVRGIAGFTCPECGQDLREAGIVTPSTHAKGWSTDPLLRAALWTLLLPIPATILSVAAYNSPLTPRQRMVTLSRAITGETDVFPQTVRLQQYDADQYWPLVQAPPATGLKYIALSIEGRMASLQVHVPTNSCTLYTGASQSLGNFDRAAVIEWMQRAGFDADHDERLSLVAQAVVDAVHDTPNMTPAAIPLAIDMRGTALVMAQPAVSRGFDQPVDWAPLLFIGAWGLVWLLGLVFILRPRRRA
jgi:hypothetical protein